MIVNFDRAVSDERTGTETLVWTPLEGFTRGDGSGSDRNSVLAQLTPRRREVLRLMCSGQNDSEIAGAMGISTFTVRNHVQAVFRTLGCHSRAQAIAIGYRGTA